MAFLNDFGTLRPYEISLGQSGLPCDGHGNELEFTGEVVEMNLSGWFSGDYGVWRNFVSMFFIPISHVPLPDNLSENSIQ